MSYSRILENIESKFFDCEYELEKDLLSRNDDKYIAISYNGIIAKGILKSYYENQNWMRYFIKILESLSKAIKLCKNGKTYFNKQNKYMFTISGINNFDIKNMTLNLAEGSLPTIRIDRIFHLENLRHDKTYYPLPIGLRWSEKEKYYIFISEFLKLTSMDWKYKTLL